MKKILLLFVFAFSINTFAQAKYLGLKAGYYFPVNLKSGVIFGIDYGYKVDESVSVLLGTDFYFKNITEDVNYGDAEQLGVKIGQSERLSQWFGWHLPVTLKARIELPIHDEAIKPFGSAGFGYGVTYVSFEKFNKQQSASLTYSGFVWQLGGGVMFGLGSRSNLIIEALYNGASFDKSESESRFTTLNSSGIVLRAGINFYMHNF